MSKRSVVSGGWSVRTLNDHDLALDKSNGDGAVVHDEREELGKYTSDKQYNDRV